MFYSELLSSPINSDNVKRLYGINPETEPARALAIGIYPLTEVPAGYNVSHYVEETNSTYTAVPHCVTIEEQQMVAIIRRVEDTFETFRSRYDSEELEEQEAEESSGGY